MQHAAFELKSEADGLRLQAYSWLPKDEPAAAVQIAHGLAEHCLRYARFATALTHAGFAVYAHEHRGHGKSIVAGGVPGDAGEAGWSGLAADVAQHSRRIRGLHAGAPVYLFGHSMGSFAAQHFILEHSADIDGVILSGSTDLGVVAEMLKAGGEPPSLAAYNAPFEPARTPFDWLSRDEAEVDAYIDDPLCGFDPPDAFSMSMMAVASEISDPGRLSNIRGDLPMLVLAGDADPLNGGLVLLKSLIGKYEAAGLTDISTKFYAGGRHEMLNETNRDEVTADIVTWLRTRQH